MLPLAIPSLPHFYSLASLEVQELSFSSPKDAVKYRLRLYNHRRSNKHLPKLTICLAENILRAGPEGWDLASAIAVASPSTLAAMQEMEKKELEEMNRLADAVEAKHKASSRSSNPFEIMKEIKARLAIDPYADAAEDAAEKLKEEKEREREGN
jgi:hypothetical protein